MREADELPLRDPIGMLGDMLREARMRLVEQKRREEQKKNRIFPIESEHANLKKQSSDEDFQSRLETFEAKQSKEN